MTVRRPAIRRLGEHTGEAAPEEGIPGRLGSELNRERDEPGRLARGRAGAGDRRVLLEETQEKGALRGKLAVDRAFREAGRRRHVIQRGQLQAPFGKDLQARLDEHGPRLDFALLPDDSHAYLRYQQESLTQLLPIDRNE